MKILVTGGCGFLGSNLAAHALGRGDEVLLLDNLYRTGSTENLAWLGSRGAPRFLHADVRHGNDVERAVASFRPEAVFHLAGQVAMTTSIENPRMDFEVNALGTLNVLEAVRRHAPGAALLYSSTNKVYGDLEQYEYGETDTRYVCAEHPEGFDESVPLEFHSPYGCSKGAADQYVLDYARVYGLRTAVFRHSSMYGGRQFATYDQGWIGWFCRMAVDTAAGALPEPFTISGSGKQVRDVLHADDMVRLYFSAAERIDAVAGQALNVGGGMANSLSLLELLSLLEGIVGAPLPFRRLPPRESDQKVFVARSDKARRLLGWEPLVGAAEGVERMVEWVRSQGAP